MKILYITQLYPPMLYGGGEYIFSKWSEEMARRGHSVSVLTQRIKGSKRFEVLNGVKIIRIPPDLQYTGSLYGISMTKNLLFLINAFRIVLSIGRAFDLIHSNTFIPTIVAEIGCRMIRKPHVATIHDVYLQTDMKFWDNWSSQSEVNSFSRNAGKIVEKIILKLRPTRVHTVSQTSRKDLIYNGVKDNALRVIPNGIDLLEYRINVKKKPFQICYVGRLVFYKNLDTVIRAMSKIVEVWPNMKFVVAGKGPYESNLKSLTRKLGLENHVDFVGRISHDKKIKLMAESQMMVQPSVVEGFGITVIESFACRTPVVSSNVMPLPELVTDGVNGMTVPPFLKEKWSEILSLYLSTPDECRRQGENGYALVEEKYTIDKVVDSFEDLYNSIITK